MSQRDSGGWTQAEHFQHIRLFDCFSEYSANNGWNHRRETILFLTMEFMLQTGENVRALNPDSREWTYFCVCLNEVSVQGCP